MIARREWTRKFWDSAGDEYTLLASVPVLEELERGEFPNKRAALQLVRDLQLLPNTEEIDLIVDAYIGRMVMPADPGGDARHLALVSYRKCDFLLTWNCKHLANANKFGHIRKVNGILRLYVPLLGTPMELLGDLYEA